MTRLDLKTLNIPQELLTINRSSEDQQLLWENALMKFFSEHYSLFTQYPDYFKLRTYEFRLLKQFLPDYFHLSQKHETLLEIGCNFGYKSLLLSPYARKLLAVDIPKKYQGCLLGDFQRTTDIARILVTEKFKITHVTFDNVWPDDLKLDEGSVDMIFTEYVLEHIPDLPKAVCEMYRVLRKGGVMIHTVPSTKDAIYPFLRANTQITFRQMLSVLKSTLGAWIKHKQRHAAHIRCNGTIVPACHSEHTFDFMTQMDIYSLENYLFPMLEVGFRVEKIFSTRENNHVLVIQK